jgi:hypothetical protein
MVSRFLNDFFRTALLSITIYATKQEIDQYRYRLGLIRITEIGKEQAMMEMIKNEYFTNLHEISTDIVQMHMQWIRSSGTSNTHSTAMLII